MRDKTAAWKSHDLTLYNKLGISFTTNLQFQRYSSTEIVLFLFQLMYKQRLDLNNILWKSDVESGRQLVLNFKLWCLPAGQTQLDSASESSKNCTLSFKNSKIKDLSWKKKPACCFKCQVVTNPCCYLAVIFCGFISHLIGLETINIPDIFSCVHSFTGKTVIMLYS